TPLSHEDSQRYERGGQGAGQGPRASGCILGGDRQDRSSGPPKEGCAKRGNRGRQSGSTAGATRSKPDVTASRGDVNGAEIPHGALYLSTGQPGESLSRRKLTAQINFPDAAHDAGRLEAEVQSSRSG